MKQIKIIMLLLISLILLATRCKNEDCHKAIAFANKSSRDVYVYHSGYGNHGIPDSSFFLPSLTSSDKIKSNETKSHAIALRECLETWVKETRGRLNVFVLDAEVYETVPRDSIFRYRMVKTITPTLEEMQNSNWTITFTGLQITPQNPKKASEYSD